MSSQFFKFPFPSHHFSVEHQHAHRAFTPGTRGPQETQRREETQTGPAGPDCRKHRRRPPSSTKRCLSPPIPFFPSRPCFHWDSPSRHTFNIARHFNSSYNSLNASFDNFSCPATQTLPACCQTRTGSDTHRTSRNTSTHCWWDVHTHWSITLECSADQCKHGRRARFCCCFGYRCTCIRSTDTRSEREEESPGRDAGQSSQWHQWLCT
jgi:hypothetical protein